MQNFFKVIVTVLCLLSLCFNSTEVFANSKNDELMKMYNNSGKISSSAPSSVGNSDKEENLKNILVL